MSNPITKQANKRKKLLRQLVKDNGFMLDGTKFAIISLPNVPKGGTLHIEPIRMTVTPE
jgi:hypothetical protein